MAKFNLPFRDIKVEYSRSHPLTKVVVIGLILVCTAALITLSWSGNQLRREIALLREEAAVLQRYRNKKGVSTYIHPLQSAISHPFLTPLHL